jgi:hypothetical protein
MQPETLLKVVIQIGDSEIGRWIFNDEARQPYLLCVLGKPESLLRSEIALRSCVPDTFRV